MCQECVPDGDSGRCQVGRSETSFYVSMSLSVFFSFSLFWCVAEGTYVLVVSLSLSRDLAVSLSLSHRIWVS